jgi:hypothetical protein
MSAELESGFRAELDDDQASLGGHGFGVLFRRQGDRWTDIIFGPDPAGELAMSGFVAPDSVDSARVANPVYQEVQLHGPASGLSRCLLLTGLSSHHHFSAAVTLSMNPLRTGRVLLDFDVADRCRTHVESLAATYLVGLDSGALVAANPECIAWDVGRPTFGRLEVVAGPLASLAMAEGGRKATRVQVLATIHPGSFTHRLRYGWRWTSADGLTR